MSILVRGVKLPESCSRCDMSAQISMPSGDIIRCRFGKIVKTPINDPYDVSNRRFFNCPLVALPDKHGRLIDENEVRIVMNWLLTQPQRPTWNDLYHAIQEMNAVIEEEGSE